MLPHDLPPWLVVDPLQRIAQQRLFRCITFESLVPASLYIGSAIGGMGQCDHDGWMWCSGEVNGADEPNPTPVHLAECAHTCPRLVQRWSEGREHRWHLFAQGEQQARLLDADLFEQKPLTAAHERRIARSRELTGGLGAFLETHYALVKKQVSRATPARCRTLRSVRQVGPLRFSPSWTSE